MGDAPPIARAKSARTGVKNVPQIANTKLNALPSDAAAAFGNRRGEGATTDRPDDDQRDARHRPTSARTITCVADGEIQKLKDGAGPKVQKQAGEAHGRKEDQLRPAKRGANANATHSTTTTIDDIERRLIA